ncbi:MAG: porin family protein [Chryseobacterium sp.]|nr:porin family protein [Chryseobacterium sp.]
MKKIHLLLLMAASSFLFAQTHFGVKAGYNLSGYKAGNYQLDNKSFFYFGGVAEHQLSEKFSLQIELLFTELGGDDTQDLYDIVGGQVVYLGTQKVILKFPQIQIPVSAKYYISKPFSLSAGFNFGINIDPNVEYNPENFYNKSGKIGNVKTVNIFPFVGTEYRLTENIFIDARYHFNFIKINKEGNIDNKVSIFQIGLGYRFK